MHSGAQLGGYRIIERLGAGGMGTVWLAEHMMLGRRAALKLLHADMSMRRDMVRRFFNEARAATAIADPGIVQIFDFGYHDDGSAFIVMELLEGETLEARLGRAGTLPVEDALRITRQVASTLGSAHARGIIHRDVKPENIFLVRDPEVAGGERAKMLDFGVAKLMDEYKTSATMSGAIGTPLYMAPEQCRGYGLVDQRADVYALGCVLFALLVGGPPFPAETPAEVFEQHQHAPPPAPSSRVANIPPEVDAIVLRCLAKEPEHRFESANELARAISEVLGAPRRPSTPLPVNTATSASAASALEESSTVTLRVPDESDGTQGPTRPLRAQAAATLPGAPAPAKATLRGPAVVGPSVAPRTQRRAGARVWLAIAAAAIVAGVAGAFAWHAIASGDDTAAAPAPPAVAVSAPAAAPAPVVAPPAPQPQPDPRDQLSARVSDVLHGFLAWSRDHAGAPCPDLAALGTPASDPWGTPLAVTCTAQPRDQIVGVISAGPDRAMGTADDIASWQLDPSITAPVRGSPWPPHVASSQPPPHKRVHHALHRRPQATHTSPRPPAITVDENGVPVDR